VDKTVVMDKCSPSSNNLCSGQLPLHLLMKHNPPRTKLSDEGDCFRLFLRIYSASADIEDGDTWTPYLMALDQKLSAYFIRLLLAADPTIAPATRRDLNYAAR
jgi:hypothetical protein